MKGGRILNIAWVAAVAIALGTDAFSLSLAIGLAGIRNSMLIRLPLVVAVFHVFMPLIGMLAGQALGTVLGHYAGWLGALVLIVLGGRMLYRVVWPAVEHYPFREAREALFRKNAAPSAALSGFGIYLLAASVSLDALTVGFSLGTIRTDIYFTVLIIGLIAGLMTATGLILGRVMGTRLGDKAELLGGLALVLIGVKLLFS
jgi:putative Mn2+ efflux pump MntP